MKKERERALERVKLGEIRVLLFLGFYVATQQRGKPRQNTTKRDRTHHFFIFLRKGRVKKDR